MGPLNSCAIYVSVARYMSILGQDWWAGKCFPFSQFFPGLIASIREAKREGNQLGFGFLLNRLDPPLTCSRNFLMEGDEQHQGNTEVEGAHIPAPWMDDQETTTVAREESRPEDGT